MDKKIPVKNIFTYTFIAAISLFFLFIWNPFQLVIYSLFLGLIIYIITGIGQYGRLKLNGNNFKRYLTGAALTYLVILTLYSVSPYLRLKEFQLVHPNYGVVEGDANAAHYGVYRQKGNLYGFVDVDYNYDVNGTRYAQQQKEALKFYSFPIFSNTKRDYLENCVNREFSRIRQQRSYVIMVNHDRPEESRFFSGREIFYWSGSMLKNFLSGILFMIAVVATVGLFAFLFRNYKRPSPVKKKSLVKLIGLIFLIIFGLFFITYLVLLIYFKSTGKL